MTFDPRADEGEPIGRPAPLFPRQSSQDRTLVLVIAVLCFLACLCAIAALASDRAASGWRRELGASATVQVRPKAGESASEAAARAAEALAGARGVTEARALDREAAGKTAGALARDGEHSGRTCRCPASSPSISIPHHPADAATLNQALNAAGVDATVDDHSRWIEDVRRTGDVASRRGARRAPAVRPVRRRHDSLRHPRDPAGAAGRRGGAASGGGGGSLRRRLGAASIRNAGGRGGRDRGRAGGRCWRRR